MTDWETVAECVLEEDHDLWAELAAWDALSDEALANFDQVTGGYEQWRDQILRERPGVLAEYGRLPCPPIETRTVKMRFHFCDGPQAQFDYWAANDPPAWAEVDGR